MLTILFFFFFFNDTATTEIYTLSLHDALPISCHPDRCHTRRRDGVSGGRSPDHDPPRREGLRRRSEEHTSELQSQSNLVCRLLLEKKKHTSPLVVRKTHAYCVAFLWQPPSLIH